MKDERVYVGHVLRCISRIEEYTVEGRDRFFSSHLIQDGVIRKGDHPPRHVHVYRDGKLVVKWDLDNRNAMKGCDPPGFEIDRRT